MDTLAAWSVICNVDVSHLVELLPSIRWPQVKGGQPNRVHIPQDAESVIDRILIQFGRPVRYESYYACLSRLVPGCQYEYHQDPQPAEWITRVHVPLQTNERSWFAWQPDCERVHFEVGKAYSFNTLIAHAFWNEGDTDRVHMTFDVLAG